MKKPILALVAAATFLQACAGREADPVDVVQPRDADLSCNDLRLEINANSTQLSALLGEQKKKQNANVAAGVAGAVIFFPALFFLDLKGAAKSEAQALQSRNAALVERHNAKGCKPAIELQTAEEQSSEE